MPELVLDQKDQLWAQLQLLQSQVVDQILSGDTLNDWVSADLWLAEQLAEIEPGHFLVFTSSGETGEQTWAAYQNMRSRSQDKEQVQFGAMQQSHHERDGEER